MKDFSSFNKEFQNIYDMYDNFDDIIHNLNQLAFEDKKVEFISLLKKETSGKNYWLIDQFLFMSELSNQSLDIILKHPLYKNKVNSLQNNFEDEEEEDLLSFTFKSFINSEDYVKSETYLKDKTAQEEIYNDLIARLDVLIDNGANINRRLNSKKFFVHNMEIIEDFIPDFFEYLKLRNVSIEDEDLVYFIKNQNLTYSKKLPSYMEKIFDMFPDFKRSPAIIYACFNITPYDLSNKIYYHPNFAPDYDYLKENNQTISDYGIQENPFLIEFLVKKYNIDLNEIGFDIFNKVSYPETVKLLFELGLKCPENINEYPNFIRKEFLKIEKNILDLHVNKNEIEESPQKNIRRL